MHWLEEYAGQQEVHQPQQPVVGGPLVLVGRWCWWAEFRVYDVTATHAHNHGTSFIPDTNFASQRSPQPVASPAGLPMTYSWLVLAGSRVDWLVQPLRGKPRKVARETSTKPTKQLSLYRRSPWLASRAGPPISTKIRPYTNLDAWIVNKFRNFRCRPITRL